MGNDLKKLIKINNSNVVFAPASYRGRIELGIGIITSEEKLSGSVRETNKMSDYLNKGLDHICPHGKTVGPVHKCIRCKIALRIEYIVDANNKIDKWLEEIKEWEKNYDERIFTMGVGLHVGCNHRRI